MGALDGKLGLIFGVADHHSIAWGIAQKLYAEGAKLAYTYMPRFEKNVRNGLVNPMATHRLTDTSALLRECSHAAVVRDRTSSGATVVGNGH